MIPSAYSVYLLSTSIYPDLQYISEYVLFDQGYKLKALKVQKLNPDRTDIHLIPPVFQTRWWARCLRSQPRSW